MYIFVVMVTCNYFIRLLHDANVLVFIQVDEMNRNISEIEQLLDEIAKVQDDIITKPATANKC